MAHLFCKYQKRITAQDSCCQFGGELEEKFPRPFCTSHGQRSCGKIDGGRCIAPIDYAVAVLLQRIKKQCAGEVMKVPGGSAHGLRELPQDGLHGEIEGDMKHLHAATAAEFFHKA